MPITDGWFSEAEALWPGQRFALQVDAVLEDVRSDFQDVLMFKSKTYGNVLVLDGVIQLTERDEFAYQEMMTHVAMMAHPAPRRVLIIGGGDGGVLREVCRHPSVQAVTMCELDPKVCELSKKHLPGVATAFGDPRVTLLHADGALFMDQGDRGEWDVVIVDSSDPVGPAEVLFQQSFFAKAARALEPRNGIFCMQGECMWLHLDIIQGVMTDMGHLFPSVDYGYLTIPTYPSGQIGFVIVSHNPTTIFRAPARTPDKALAQQLRYYSPEIHAAAFVLPAFAEKALKPFRKQPVPSQLELGFVLAAAAALGVGLGMLLVRR